MLTVVLSILLESGWLKGPVNCTQFEISTAHQNTPDQFRSVAPSNSSASKQSGVFWSAVQILNHARCTSLFRNIWQNQPN